MQSETHRRERSRSRTSATTEGGRRLHATHTPASPRREREAELRSNRTLISPQAASPTDVEGDRFPALKSSATAVKRQPPSDEAVDSSPSATIPSLSQTFSDEDIDQFLDIAAPPPAGGGWPFAMSSEISEIYGLVGWGVVRTCFFREFPRFSELSSFRGFRDFRDFPGISGYRYDCWNFWGPPTYWVSYTAGATISAPSAETSAGRLKAMVK